MNAVTKKKRYVCRPSLAGSLGYHGRSVLFIRKVLADVTSVKAIPGKRPFHSDAKSPGCDCGVTP